MRKTAWVPLIFWIFILIISFLPIGDLLHNGLPVTHDGQDHVARIANFYRSLTEGNLIPRWASDLNWGYGHPILMFLYPLPSYVASFFHAIGFSLVDSTKLVFAGAYVLSVVFMYFWAAAAWGTEAGFVAAVLYGLAPYRFVDLYVRGAIGEHTAFIFPPLICFGILLLSRSTIGKYTVPSLLIVFGTMFLILSHNALSLMFLPLILMYAGYVYAYETKDRATFAVFVLSGIAFGFLLSAFYWVPALLEGKYTLRDIVTKGEFSSRFVPWLSFLYSPWSYGGGNELTKWLGAGQLAAVVMAFFVSEKHSRLQRLIIVLLFILFFTLFAMTSGATPLWNTVSLIQKFQFPWRLLSVAVFVLSVIGAVTVAATDERRRIWAAVLITIFCIAGTFPMWHAKTYRVYKESRFSGIYDGTTDTGESSPIWSVRFMEKRPQVPIFVWPPSGSITPLMRSTTVRSYSVTVTEPVRLVENTLYFPGWTVTVNGKALPSERLIYQDPTYRGLMTFDLDAGTYDIRFAFSDTKLRIYAQYISAASFIILALILGTIRLLWRKKT